MPDAAAQSSGFKRYFCPHCGYDVSATATGNPCPECGNDVTAEVPHIFETASPEQFDQFLGDMRRVALLIAILAMIYILAALSQSFSTELQTICWFGFIAGYAAHTLHLCRTLRRLDGVLRWQGDNIGVALPLRTIRGTRVLSLALICGSALGWFFGQHDQNALTILVFVVPWLEYALIPLLLEVLHAVAVRTQAPRFSAVVTFLSVPAWIAMLWSWLPPLAILQIIVGLPITAILYTRWAERLSRQFILAPPHTPPSS